MYCKLSVIVPVYKVEQYLEKCIDSIIGQTIKDFMIILVDDGSTDNSGSICDEYIRKDHRVITVHQNNAGQGAARNAGMALSQGDWLGFVDADDWIDSNYYQRLVECAEAQNADMAVCDRHVYDEQGLLVYEAKISEGKSFNVLDPENYFYDFFFKYTPSVCNKIYRSNLVGGVVFQDLRIIGTEDMLFNYEIMFKLNRVTEVSEIAYNGLVRQNSTARSYSVGDLEKNYHLLEQMLKIADKYRVSDNTCFCAYNFYSQRTWNQIKVYGSLDARKHLYEELEREERLPRTREFSKKMLRLKMLDHMGYHKTGILAVKLIYLLKLLNVKRLVECYIFETFIKD